MGDNNVVPLESSRCKLVDSIAKTIQAYVDCHWGGTYWASVWLAANAYRSKQQSLSIREAFCIEENQCLAKGLRYCYFYTREDDRILA